MSQRSRNWVFTVNNPVEGQWPVSEEIAQQERYLVYQYERGSETQTLHIQGYVVWKNPKTFDQCKLICPRARWSVRCGSHAQARDYCKKEDTREPGTVPVERGEEPQGQGTRNDILALQQALQAGNSELQIADQLFPLWVRHFRAIREYRMLRPLAVRSTQTLLRVYWGPPGTGKTTRARREAEAHAGSSEGVYWLSRPTSSSGTIWFTGYQTGVHKVLVIDEYYGWITRDLLQRLCGQDPLTVPVSVGVNAQFTSDLIIITSNTDPQQWYSRLGLGAMERRMRPPLGMVEYMGDVYDPDEIRIANMAMSFIASSDDL